MPSPPCPTCHPCCHPWDCLMSPGLLSCAVPAWAVPRSPPNPRRRGLREHEARCRPHPALISFHLSPLSGASVCPSVAAPARRGGHGSSLRRQSAPPQGLRASTPASPVAAGLPAPRVCRVGMGRATLWAPRMHGLGLCALLSCGSVCQQLCPCRRAQLLLSGRWQRGAWPWGAAHPAQVRLMWGCLRLRRKDRG